MPIRVVAVGRVADAGLRAAADEYLRRIRRHMPVDVVEVADESLAKRSALEVLRAEEARVLPVLRKSSYVILADSGGKLMSSEGFARMLEGLFLAGKSNITFVIGGTLGAGERVRATADDTVSFSRMTMAHGLARVVLLEQVYRAFTIMRGEKYHR